MGIERSRKAAERAQIIILMRDNDTDYPTLDIRDGQTVIKVHNKSEDFQALTGKGMDWLELQLLNSVPTANDDEVLITNIRHKQALDISLLDIQRTLDALEQNLPGDLIAEDLRQCLHHLSQITGGAIDTEEVLGNIFSHFCVGK
jgi:tRNA modification GTPase